jgi:hypothetical protein
MRVRPARRPPAPSAATSCGDLLVHGGAGSDCRRRLVPCVRRRVTMSEPLHLVTTKPDAEVVAEIKEKVAAALRQVCVAFDDAKASGFEVGFQVGPDFLGKFQITQLTVMKKF